jgi:hypothetical protein
LEVSSYFIERCQRNENGQKVLVGWIDPRARRGILLEEKIRLVLDSEGMSQSVKDRIVILAAVSVIAIAAYVLWLSRKVDTGNVNSIVTAVKKLTDLIPSLPGATAGESAAASSQLNPIVIAIGALFVLTAWSLFHLRKT